MTLKLTIESLAADFARGVLTALRTASLQDILAQSNASASTKATSAKALGAALGQKRGPGRPAKNAGKASAVAASGDSLASVVSLLSSKPEGLRAEDIRKTLGIDKPTVTKILKKALATKALKKQGQKRATTYFAR